MSSTFAHLSSRPQGLLQREPSERLGCDKLGGGSTIKAQAWFSAHGVKWDVILRRRALSPLALDRLQEAPPPPQGIMQVAGGGVSGAQVTRMLATLASLHRARSRAVRCIAALALGIAF